MTTPKTPLPNYLIVMNRGNIDTINLINGYNQILNFLKEREEEESEAYNKGWNEGQTALVNMKLTINEIEKAQPEKPTYAQGYEQGRFDAEMNKLNEAPPEKLNTYQGMTEETIELCHKIADNTWDAPEKPSLLCHWYGKPVYRETASRKVLLEIIDRLQQDLIDNAN